MAIVIARNSTSSITFSAGSTGPQGPPGPAVAPGTPGQVYVTNAAGTAPAFDSTVTIVPGSHLAVLAPDASIKQTQGGTLPSPSPAYPIVLQPRDPAKAPFHLGYLAAATFNSTVDITMATGYNTDLNSSDAALYWRLEQDYEVTPGVHWFEYYIEYASAGAHSSFIRPFYLNINKATNSGQMIFELPSPARAGTITFASGDLTQNYINITDAQTTFRNDYSISQNSNTVTPLNVALTTTINYLVLGDATNAGTVIRSGADGVYLEYGAGSSVGLHVSGTTGVLTVPTLAGSGTGYISLDASGNLSRVATVPTSAIAPGTAGQMLVSNATPAAAWTSLVSYETTHGRFSAGNGGSDTVAVIGPLVGAEATFAALWLLPHATAASSSNYLITASAADSYYNFPAGGTLHLSVSGVGDYATLTATDFLFGAAFGSLGVNWSTTTAPIVRSGTSCTSLTVGTNKTGASLVLQSDAATTNQTLTATADAFGGSGATAPLTVDWSTSTIPTVGSGTSATGLTIGTNKTSASTNLRAGNAALALQLNNPGGGAIVETKTLGQHTAHQVSKGANYTIDSSGAGDEQVWVTAAATITLPNPASAIGRVIEIIVGYDPAVGGGTIARFGGENINGAAANITLVTGDKYSIIQIRTNGTDWIAKGGLSI